VRERRGKDLEYMRGDGEEDMAVDGFVRDRSGVQELVVRIWIWITHLLLRCQNPDHVIH